jgi:hypothetical protein
MSSLRIIWCSCGLQIYECMSEYHKTTILHKNRIIRFHRSGNNSKKIYAPEFYEWKNESIDPLPLELCLMMSDEHF